MIFTTKNTIAQRKLKHALTALRPKLYRLAWSWCHDSATADDLVQGAMLRGLERAGQLKDHAKLEIWIVQIMINLYRDGLRRRQQDVLQAAVPLDDEQLPAVDGPETALQLQQQVSRVLKAIDGLNEEQRLALTLVDILGYTYADAAAALEVPVGTVMSRLSRARARLAVLLEPAESVNNNNVTVLRRVK